MLLRAAYFGILVELGLCKSWSVCLFFFFSYFTLELREVLWYIGWGGGLGLHRNVSVEGRMVVYVFSDLGTSGSIYSL